MPYLNKLRREEFSPQISSAIRACIDQHIFGGLQSATQKLSLDTNYLYDCSSSAVKSDCVAEPALSEYDYLSADELERDYHVAPGIHVVSSFFGVWDSEVIELNFVFGRLIVIKRIKFRVFEWPSADDSL